MALDPAELLPEEEEEAPALPLLGPAPPPAEGLGLTPLLPGLRAGLGPDGLSAGLRGELREAQAALALHRRTRLRWDGLWRALQELLRDPSGIEATARRELQLRCGAPSTAQALPPMEVTPAPLLPLLELRLAAKLRDLSIYHGGGPAPEPSLAEAAPTLIDAAPPLAEARAPPPLVDAAPALIDAAPPLAEGRAPPPLVDAAPTLIDAAPPLAEARAPPPLVDAAPALIDAAPPLAEAPAPPPRAALLIGSALREEARRLQRARRRRQHLQGALRSQRGRYQEVLGRCWALLGALAGAGCAGALQELDQEQGLYLEGKGVALLLKTRLEELGLLLASYPPPTVAAHQCIKRSLSLAVDEAERRGQELRAALSAYQGLGAGLEELAAAYGRLREAVEQKRWALRQLRPPRDVTGGGQ